MAVMKINYMSYSLKRYVEFNVILPIEDTKTYSPNPIGKPEAYKTLYLLHGFSGNCNDWLNGSSIAKIARDHNLAVVMPSGENSFYEDQIASGEMYGSFVGKELVDATRTMFPLSHKKEDTFIGGLSMGGFGALLLGSRFAETFGAIIALSGGYLPSEILKVMPEAMENIGTRDYFTHIFGDLDNFNGSEKDPVYHVQKAIAKGNMPRMYMACGREDYVFDVNVKQRDELLALGVDLTWSEDDGEHEWTFWEPYIHKAGDWLLYQPKAIK